MDRDDSMLNQTLKIKDLDIKNRVVMPPMCMYSAAEDGIATDFHVVHYATRAYGGVGLIIQEATAVEPEGRITVNDLGIWDDEHIKDLKRIVDNVHEAGAKMGIQIAHAGRKANLPKAYAPSAVAYEGYEVPTEMTLSDIDRVIDKFRQGAKRARLIGYDLIELHAAHGYLINEFLSPLSNKRTDKYKDGALFLEDIVKATREEWPMDKPLCVRITAEEYMEEGLHPEDLAEMINRVKGLGVDLVDVSSGGNYRVRIKLFSGYQLGFAETIKKETRLPVIGGGLIEDVASAEQAVQDGQCDMVYLGRLLLRDPYVVINNLDIPYPKPYVRGQKKK